MKKVLMFFALLGPAFGLGAQELRLLVGTYTEGTAAEGVYLYAFEEKTAEARLLSVAPSGNPSFVIASEDGRMVYSVNEFSDGRQGVSAYSLEEDALTLRRSVTLPQGREDPCNLLHTGDALISSNYTGGTLSAFALDGEGDIIGETQTFSPAPAGSTLEGRLEASPHAKDPAHMHCAVISPDGKYIFTNNLGNDCIHRFQRGQGGSPLGRSEIAWQHRGREKFGPRHMVFSADGRFAYLLCELGDKLVVFSYSDGQLTPIQTLTAYNGKGHGSADIHLSPDGRFLYTSHRLKKDGIAIFEIAGENGFASGSGIGVTKAWAGRRTAQAGTVRAVGYVETGAHPRNFAISPSGDWLLCACRDSNRIEIYSIDRETGALSPTAHSIAVAAPVCVQFL